MGKKSKATPSQMAMSEVLEKEFKDELNPVKDEANKPAEVVETKTKAQPQKRRKRGSKYVSSRKKINDQSGNTAVAVADAIKLIQSVVFTSFKETLELHVNVLEVGLRGEVALPFATGKQAKVAIATDELITNMEKGIIDFDILVADVSMMPKLTKFAKILGPRGLMPNPKAGTLGPNTAELAKKFSGNTVRFKTEPKAAIIHCVIGKTNDDSAKLLANIEAFIEAISRKNIKDAFLCSSMSPSVEIILD